MQQDLDGSDLPELNEFWEQWNKVIYTGIANALKSLGRQPTWDNVMDMMTSEFAFRYEAYRQHFHPGHGKPFSAYVVGATKHNVFRAITTSSRQEHSQLEEQWDQGFEEAESLIPWEVLNHDQFWVLKKVMHGHSLKELSEKFDIPYSQLRTIMTSIRTLLEGII